MFFKIGTPERLASLSATNPSLERRRSRVAVIDDEPFIRADALRASGFDLIEIGDISSIESVANYPIVVCDIKGVGVKFKSKFEGAHVIAEIRNTYPDKYLIAFTGMTFDATYNAKLAKADISATKDVDTEAWTQILDSAIKEVSDPTRRWLRFRKHLLAQDIDLYDVFLLEQAFIKSIKNRDQTQLINASRDTPISKETKELIVAFSASAVSQLIQGAVGL